MIVTCPQCETSFSLPDELYRPGRKARCSQCSFVFRMPGTPEPAGAGALEPLPEESPGRPGLPPGPPSRRKKNFVLVLIILLCFAGIGYGGYTLYGFFFARDTLISSGGTGKDNAAGLSAEEKRRREEQEELVRSLDLDGVTQFVVENDNLHRLVVIQGEVVNKFSSPKEFIQVEALLYDEQKNILAQTQQLCGVTLTLFQLKVLTQKELEEALNNRVSILTNNVDIQPGSRVPFMVVFPNLPEGVFSDSAENRLAAYRVRVIDARDPQ
ncbi:MAG: zinc-ribbon domain-containing protein [Desulfovibrio sp.]|jgi:predicted Zn finger-like uncharacterized protein|nr:zinc-ribbon domain-containing protein [Desulfovibrio sp.]